jgi:DNA-binding NarL/FixJ family response regulator
LKYEQGWSDEDIAAELGYSRATIERRVKSILELAALYWGLFD